jgi:hypothetical protein
MFAAYLENTKDGHDKHYFVMVDYVGEDKHRTRHWAIRVAWSPRSRTPTDAEQQTKIRGKTDAFANEKNAEAYAKAMIKSKVGEGYVCAWSSERGGTAPTNAYNNGPEWFRDRLVNLGAAFSGTTVFVPDRDDAKTLVERLTEKKPKCFPAPVIKEGIDDLLEKPMGKMTAEEISRMVKAGAMTSEVAAQLLARLAKNKKPEATLEVKHETREFVPVPRFAFVTGKP